MMPIIAINVFIQAEECGDKHEEPMTSPSQQMHGIRQTASAKKVLQLCDFVQNLVSLYCLGFTIIIIMYVTSFFSCVLSTIIHIRVL